MTVNQPSADPAEEEADAGAVVRVDRLTVTYGAFTAVRDVSFRIPPGEVFGLVGPNGAGKTSIVEAVGGLRRPARDGAISVCGHDPRTDREAVTRLVGMQLQESQFPSRARVGELCELYEAIYRAPGASAALLESFGLADRRRSLIADLSGGMRQRLALALAQIGDVRLVVLDELTTGLDPHQRRETWRSVLDLAARGVAVLLTSHAMDEVEALCDRVGVLRAGELVALDAPARLTEAHAGPSTFTIDLRAAADGGGREAGGIGQRLDCLGLTRLPGGPDRLEFAGTFPADYDRIVRLLADAGLPPSAVSRRTPTFEDAYLDLVGGTARKEVA
ncbi:ABC transporter ATP-binding protein [Kitasatospora sp. CM 4170]|uniref:ABC transporter ATP-binding protein n=1 Tax=Kitasatospora aburaviensis TaxID=67265 RepID=A0ABW1F5N5_9ACTN|nr:ABC transporter ATP-binding protein [Kitasatospora sp. CM 4170]WNM43275.1 ABC transporter ATP-binding protein [Kitasatospora sp. CM 4170]